MTKQTHKKNQPAVTISQVLKFYYDGHVTSQCIDWMRQKLAMQKLEELLGAEQQIGSLAPLMMLDYARQRKVAAGTIRRELTVLTAAINYAVKHKLLSAADKPHIALPPAPPPKDIWLSEVELKQLIEEAVYTFGAMSRVHRFVVLASNTAARKQSILSLTWAQVDLEAGVIHFEADGKRQKGKRRVPVPISRELSAMLHHPLLTEERIEGGPEGHVCFSRHSIQDKFNELTRRCAEKTGNRKFLKVTPHTLRHTWATLAARAGVDLWQIAGVLGDTVGTVQKNYLHHCPDHLRGAVNFRERQANP